MILEEKTIAVFGAGGLLGSSLVAQLLKENAKVVALDLRTGDIRDRLIQTDSVLFENLMEYELDITNEEAVAAFFQSCPRLDGVVNASYPRNKAYGAHFEQVSLGNFNENLSLHLGSSFLLMREAASFFKLQQEPLSFVNIASVYGVVAPRFDIYRGTSMTMPVEYAAIKAAVLHLTKYVTSYVGDSRFRVNSVSPGGILDRQPEQFLSSYQTHTNGRGMLQVQDVLGTIVFLLSDQALYVTGQNIVVDDGFTL
jgi:NAD(P)-dependent dehydrogenase (short-subunit alcohol dehydrogenase family)